MAGTFARVLPGVRFATKKESAFAPDAWRRPVVAGWIALTLAALAFVALFGRNSPWADEWMLLGPLVGERPVWPWLWEAHNEHRYPLPRLAWFLSHRMTGHDFRAGMVGSVTLLATASWALLNAARNIRGRSHPADLFLPAVLLHWWHCENLLMGYQVAFTLPVALAAGVLVLASRQNLTPRTVALAGWAAVAIALCGGAGVVMAGPLTVWAFCAGVGTTGLAERPLSAALTALPPGIRDGGLRRVLLVLVTARP